MESTLTRHVSPISPYIFPHLATVLLVIGAFFAGWFFVFEATRLKYQEESVIVKELLISLCAAVFLGLGTFFLLLAVGIYV